MGILSKFNYCTNFRSTANAESGSVYRAVRRKTQSLAELFHSTGKCHTCQILPIEDVQERIEIARWLEIPS